MDNKPKSHTLEDVSLNKSQHYIFQRQKMIENILDVALANVFHTSKTLDPDNVHHTALLPDLSLQHIMEVLALHEMCCSSIFYIPTLVKHGRVWTSQLCFIQMCRDSKCEGVDASCPRGKNVTEVSSCTALSICKSSLYIICRQRSVCSILGKRWWWNFWAVLGHFHNSVRPFLIAQQEMKMFSLVASVHISKFFILNCSHFRGMR